MTYRTYVPGSAVFFDGDECRGIYYLESGLVGVRKTNADGSSALLHLVYPGQPFGFELLLVARACCGSAECIKPSRIGFIGKSAFTKMLDAQPALMFKLLKLTLVRLHEADEKNFQSKTLPVRARLAYFISELKKRTALSTRQNDIVLELPVNRRYLADLIGVRPETVSRTIKEIEDDGVAQFTNRTVRIPKWEALENEIEPVIV
ncbi:MAG: Crp/Fnr family transcriptional regulator [Rhodospirillales bacterium]